MPSIAADRALTCADRSGSAAFPPLTVRQMEFRTARLGRLYNGAVVAVERNNHGHAVLEALLHSFHYENIYAHETEAAGFTLRERGPVYAEFILEKPDFFDPQVRALLPNYANDEGYAQRKNDQSKEEAA